MTKAGLRPGYRRTLRPVTNRSADLVGGPLPAGFRRRRVTIPVAGTRSYDHGTWSDALVVVERGVLELEFVDGARRRFGTGEMLWLDGLPVRALHSAGTTATVAVAISRC